MSTRSEPSATSLAALADAAGLRRVHLLAWRDLADSEAGGSEIHAAEIATRWAAAGIDVVMRTSRADGQGQVDDRDGYRVIRRAGRYAVFLDAPLQELLGRSGRADGLVEVWNGIPFFTPLWSRVPRVTFIHHVHEEMWEQSLSPVLARFGRAVETRLAPRLYRHSRILTPSESSRHDIMRRLGLPGERIGAVPNGVHTRFRPGGTRAARPQILVVSRLVPHKRVELVVDAACELRRDIPELELVIVGDGYQRDELERMVHDRAADDWIGLTGRVDDDALVAHYQRSWVVVSASMAEGWGLALSEAAATGTAVVATDIPGHRDVVVDGSSGLLVEADQLADALRRVLTDPDLRATLEAGARERARALTWDVTACGVLEALAAEAASRRQR